MVMSTWSGKTVIKSIKCAMKNECYYFHRRKYLIIRFSLIYLPVEKENR